MKFDVARFLAVVADAVLAVDREGKISFWNASAERMLGYSTGEAVGASLDLIIPERHRERHWSAYFRVMETGRTKLGLDVLYVTALRKDGAELRLALRVGVLRTAQGAIEAIGAILREHVDPPRRNPPAG